MKKILSLLIFFFMFHSRGETFIGPTSGTNKLVILSDEAIVTTTIQIDQRDGYDTSTYAKWISAGKTHDVIVAESWGGRSALAGPGELILTNRVVISFRRLKGSNIRTIVLIPAMPGVVYGEEGYVTKATIDVPENKTIRFFFPMGGAQAGLSIQKGSLSIDNTTLFDNVEYDGPLTLTINGITEQQLNGPPYSRVISYYFTEDFLVVPELGLLKAGTGSFSLTVQKSVDLKNWFPAMEQHTSSDQQAYYRLRISK